jgi:hypothetical protein
MEVLGHHHGSDYDKLVAPPDLLQNGEQQVPAPCLAQEWLPLVTTGGDKVEIPAAIEAL